MRRNPCDYPRITYLHGDKIAISKQTSYVTVDDKETIIFDVKTKTVSKLDFEPSRAFGHFAMKNIKSTDKKIDAETKEFEEIIDLSTEPYSVLKCPGVFIAASSSTNQIAVRAKEDKSLIQFFNINTKTKKFESAGEIKSMFVDPRGFYCGEYFFLHGNLNGLWTIECWSAKTFNFMASNSYSGSLCGYQNFQPFPHGLGFIGITTNNHKIYIWILIH